MNYKIETLPIFDKQVKRLSKSEKSNITDKELLQIFKQIP